jgi:aspartyl protease family protein
MSSGSIMGWAAFALIGVALVAPSLKSGDAAAPATAAAVAASAVATPPRAGNGLASRELVRGPDGHFYADAQVNGANVRFMVDTGASVVVLTPADAQRAGIPLPPIRVQAMGVGGAIEVIPVTIDRIALGPLETRGVQAAVAEQLPVSLLGQSFLGRVGSVEIRGDRMVLR